MNKFSDRIQATISFIELRPVLPLVVSLAAGIITGRYFGTWLIGLLCASIALLIATALRIKARQRAAFYTFAVACFFLGTALMAGSDRAAFSNNHISNFTRSKVNLEGRITGPILYYNESVKCLIQSEKIHLEHEAYVPVEGLVRLTIKQPSFPYAIGDLVRFETRLRKIESYGTPGVFDREKFYKRRGITVEAYVRNEKKIGLVQKAKAFSLSRAIEHARTKIRDYITRYLPSPQNQIINAVVLGEKDRIPPETIEVFRKGGVAHLLAISGMHIGSIFILVYLLCVRLFRFSEWACKKTNIFKISILIALVPALFYAELAGWRISVTRALLMVAVGAIAVLLGKQRDLLSALGAAAFLTLLIWPYALFEPAFQLSYSAVLAVTIIAPGILRIKKEASELDQLKDQKQGKRWVKWLVISLASSIGATLITAPITAYHFGTIAPYAFISNLFMVPLYTLIVVPASLLGALLLFIAPGLATYPFFVSTLAVDLGYAGTNLVSGLPASQIWMGQPTWLEIAAFTGLLVSVLNIRKRPFRYIAAACVAVLLIVPTWISYDRKNSEVLKVTVIDIGQGLSQLIEFPGGETWLVDGGGYPFSDFDVGKAVVGPFLRSKRIRTLDRVVNTHPHPDHFVGLSHVLDAFRVKEITLSGLSWDKDDRYAQLIKKIDEMSIKQTKVTDFSKLEAVAGNVQVQWLHPPSIDYDADESTLDIESWSLNDRSMVIKLTYGNCSILLPADIEKKAEGLLVEKGVDLRSDVFVSPHHGSRTSSTPEFLAAVRPDSVIVPVGRNNRYGLPSMPVLERYAENSIEIYRTDLNGTVEATCTTTESLIRVTKNFKP